MFEICCGSYQDALCAMRGGATRIELNSALHLGGLTPSVASLRLTKSNTNLKVICMVRSRAAGFCYNEIEYWQMLEEAKDLLENGADGLAFGFLDIHHQIDTKRTAEMVKLIKSYHKEAVFHRAYDCVKDPYTSIKLLIDLGIDRVLTSGLQDKAWDGKEIIKTLQARYGSQIEILAGSGVNVSNALELVAYTKIKQIHSSCKNWSIDPTTSGENVNYCYGPAPYQNAYDNVDESLVAKLADLEL